MIFLLQQEYHNAVSSNYNFHAYDYGPYSSTLQSDVNELILQTYLREDEEKMPDGRLKYTYQITPRGDRLVRALLRNPKLRKYKLRKIYQLCEEVKGDSNHTNLNDLLKGIYSRYPEYAKFSIFKF